MPDNFRFRINWRRKLILQRRERRLTGDAWGGWYVYSWRDADAEDLAEFVRLTLKEQP